MKGTDAESAALAHLEAAGLSLIERNYRCPMGEIDLVMKEGEAIVFVEVRQRSGTRFGGAPASITTGKKKRILSAAKHYMIKLGSWPECRFDAVLLDAEGRITWIRDAFGEEDGRALRFR